MLTSLLSAFQVSHELAQLATSFGLESVNDPRFAAAMDEKDPLAHMRSQYFIPKVEDIVRTAQHKYADSRSGTSI